MTKDWEPYQEEIRKLYQVEGKPLADVMRLVKGRHGFIASERSYRTQLRKWGYMKYSTQAFPKPVLKGRSRPRSIGANHPQTASSGSETLSIIPNPGFLGNLPAFSSVTDSYHSFNPALNQASYHIGQNEQDGDGKTQLHRAILAQDTEQVRMLLHAGASVDINDHAGNAPIHYAVIQGNVVMVRLLLQFGAEVNMKGQLGRSPLHLAIPHDLIISSLLREGADPSLQDDRGDTPLHLAVSIATSNPDDFQASLVSQFLEAKSDPNKMNNAGVTPFLKLLDQLKYPLSGSSWTIESFLERGADVLHVLPNGKTPLQLFLSLPGASRFGQWDYGKNDIIRSFLDQGASVMTPTTSGQPLIMEFFKKFHPNRPNMELGEKLCKLITPEEGSETASLVLHEVTTRPIYTASPPVEDLIEILLEKGADPNHKTPNQETPLLLLLAKVEKNPSAVTRAVVPLLAHGADPWRMDSSGKCAVFEAEGKYPNGGHAMLRAMLEADLRLQKSPPVRASESTTNRGRWKAWEQASRAEDWDGVKQHIPLQPNHPSRKSNNCLADSALAVLAENHVRLARDKSRGEHWETEMRRRYVAGILRDCREHGILLDDSCTDYLIELCLL